MICKSCPADLGIVGTYKVGSLQCKQCQLGKQKARRAELRSAGLCTCGGVLVVGKKSCQGCLDLFKLRARESRKTLRIETLAAYGGKCTCCGERREQFLTVDHVVPFSQGGGPRNRRGGPSLYRWLKKEGFPEGFRLLCMNCNCSRSWNGYCPHQSDLGFADFAKGGMPHVYVALNTPMRKAMQKVMLFCETSQTDINAFMAPVLKACLTKAMEGLDDLATRPKESGGDGEPF